LTNKVFITGMGRSGTTLIEKLLTNHPEIDMLSQPFPLIFIFLKSIFLESLGIKKYYVLNDDFENMNFEQKDFDLFLSKLVVDKIWIKKAFENMINYSGQYTKNCHLDISEINKEIHGFLEIFEASLNRFNLKNKKYIGSKEVMCEEFTPYLCRNRFKSIVVVRDPRDVVVSANYPKEDKHFGNKKPTLFILRTWRKSIDYLNYLRKNKNFIYIKYEDLVTDPYNTLNKITFFLDLEPFAKNHFDAGIYDRDGSLWQANSSFDTKTSFISSQSVGGYKKILSSDEINYIESICKYEMDLMGYTLDTIPNKKIIKNFRDYFIESSEHLDKNYSSLDENVEKELARYGKYNN